MRNFGMKNPILITLAPIIIIILGIFLFVIFPRIIKWFRNNSADLIETQAKIISRRTNVSSRMFGTSTWYYITFDLDEMRRLELRVTGNQFGLIVDGDHGKVTFKGTRFISFKR
jgi:hypothetical protein